MADESQLVRPIAASTPASRPQLAGLAAAKSATHFLSLPDNVFDTIFNSFSYGQGIAGYGYNDAFNLAATCRQLNKFYRHTYVIALRLCIEPHTPSDTLARALDRLPCLDSIELLERSNPAQGDSLETYLCTLQQTASMHESRSLQSRALGIKSLTLGRTCVSYNDWPPAAEHRAHGSEGEIWTECVRIAVETFSNLEYLDLIRIPAVGDDAVAAIAEHLADSVRRLRSPDKLPDGGAVHIGRLLRLKSLEMSDCYEVTDVTFDALSALEELEILELYNCSISDKAACRLLTHLRKLTALALCACKAVTSAILPFLPRSLVTLDLRHSRAGAGSLPQSALEGVPSLTSFMASGQGVDDLSFLWPVAPQLTVLRLLGASASDENVAHWVCQMPNLIELDLSGSMVSDKTAWAVSDLENIEGAYLDQTQISNEGVRALADGIACLSLRELFLESCPNIRLDDGAVDALFRAMCTKGGEGMAAVDRMRAEHPMVRRSKENLLRLIITSEQ